jgi:hypothetical protein
MTTPAPDWTTFVTQLRDPESIRFASRLIQFQREWLDNQAAQLEQIQRGLAEQEARLGHAPADESRGSSD